MFDNEKLSVLAANAAELKTADGMLHSLRQGLFAEMRATAPADTSTLSVFRTVFGDDLCTSDFALFCSSLLAGTNDGTLIQALLPEFTPVGKEFERGHTAYLSSPYSDRAFELFSRSVPALTAYHHPSFAAACEEVYYERSHYCILPVHNSEDGELTAFHRMIAKYELKLYRVCDTVFPDTDTTVRFALLRRGIVPKIPPVGYLDVRLTLPEGVHLGTFLAACEATGACIDRIRTVPTSYTNDITSLSVTFRISPHCGAPLLQFLRFALYSYSVEGIYSAV